MVLPFRRPLRRRPAPTVWAILLVLALLAWRGWNAPPSPPPVAEPGVYQVQRVVDGDTLLLTDRQRVRLIGIDTPETVKPETPPEPWGREASDFTKRMVEGRGVRLEFDRERVDQYGRTLAYVYVGDVFLNVELVRQGFSRAETRFPFRSDIKAQLLAAEAEARDARRGIWSGTTPRPAGSGR